MTTITPEAITFTMPAYDPCEDETHTFPAGTTCIYCHCEFSATDYARSISMTSARGPICAGCTMNSDRHSTGIAIG
jgi:hypothetical protein